MGPFHAGAPAGPVAPRRRVRGRALLAAGLLAAAAAPGAPTAAPLAAQGAAETVRVVSDAAGQRLQVNGRDFFVQGVNWDYFPIGTNTSYSLWTQPDDFIRAALDREMALLRSMGVNTIRVYNGIPARWIRYIHDTYGIYTVLNHALGRYGVTLNGSYIPQTDYSDPRVRQLITNEVLAIVDELQGTPGLLMWLLGNENNYGLEWSSAETENLPVGERQAAKARYLYSLVGEVARAIKARDRGGLPVALANGDLQYVDIIAEEAKGLDVFGSNVYRGKSFGDFFAVVKDKLGIPVMFTEFGADAWNEKEMREDQVAQAEYLLAQWREIYEQAAGKGGVGNSIGGLTFQWTDGWWKYGQTSRLDIHDTNASWAADAYAYDYVPGENNMNEEWWGIVAKGRTDARGMYELYPRAAFYVLQQVYQLPVYGAATDRAAIAAHFDAISPAGQALRARADVAAMAGEGSSIVSLSGMRMELATYSTGGTALTTPRTLSTTQRPSFRGFDRMESYFGTVSARPTETFQADVTVNVLGNVPGNPINELFYEARGRQQFVDGETGEVNVGPLERVRIYSANMSWDDRDFRLDAFYRTGHYHWGYEGDFFGIYREANYGLNMDIYNGEAPLGLEFTGKRKLEGLRMAFGPELWWGANPSALAMYTRDVGGITWSALWQEEVAQLGATGAVSSFAVPLPQTRRASLAAETSLRGFDIQAGVLWGGNQRVGRNFQIVEGEGDDQRVLQDQVNPLDAFGGRAKVSTQRGRYNWYAEGSVMGLIADGGPTSVQTFTGWSLRQTGLNNQWSINTGVAARFGSLEIAPNVMYQKPIVGPVPADAPQPARPRNVLVDPFAVRFNRETVGGELLFTWDPTPGTWFYQWDNDLQEDARFAANLGLVVRDLPTTQDAAIGILADGRTLFAFPGATPARTLWEVRSRMVGKVGNDLRLIANVYTGTAEPNGDSPRLVRRFGTDLRAVKGHIKVMGEAKVNDFGPFDYHRDFNLTFPRQYMADVSYVFGRPSFRQDLPQTRAGVRATWRSLNRFSPRFCPERVPDLDGSLVCDPTFPAPNGSEWEIRTYLTVAW